MTESEKRIAAAALRVFARYGVRRATMNDVAKEADVVRQTLYNVFPNKDAVLRGAIRQYVEHQWEKIHADWKQAQTLGDKLDSVFEHFVFETWRLIHSSPDARELEGGYNEAGRAEIALIDKETLAVFETMLEPFRDGFVAYGETPQSIARHFLVSLSGIKYGADTLEEAQSLAATQKAFITTLARAN